MLNKLIEKLREMNWNYGRGDLVAVTLNVDGTTGHVTRRIPTTQHTGFEETRKIRIVDGDKVRFAGQLRKFA